MAGDRIMAVDGKAPDLYMTKRLLEEKVLLFS